MQIMPRAYAVNTPLSVDVNALIDQHSIGRLQKLVVFLGFCIIALEGFDLTIMGFVVPVLKQQWHIGNRALSVALSAAQVGLVFGSLAAGPLADRFGRKVVLLVSIAAFGLCTLVSATANDLSHLILFRLLTGLAIGSVVPNTATLVSEYVPLRARSFSVSLIICGVAFSGACGGFLSAWMIPALGWRSVLVLGGILPLLMVPVLFFALPESIRFMVAKRAPAARIRSIVEKIAPGATTAQTAFRAPDASVKAAGRGAIKTVLSARYRFGSVMLWTAYFAALFASNLLSNWLPTLIKESGYGLRDAAFVTGIYQLGGVFGSLVLGWAMDRYSSHKVPSVAYLISGALLCGIAFTFNIFPLVVAQAFALGFCLIGAISGVNALSTQFYPTEARATGSCWMHAAGRSGALISIFTGAQLLSMGWNANYVLMATTVPALLAGLSIFAKQRRSS